MSRSAARAVALFVCAAAFALAPGRAMAHTKLDFSLHADGTTVGEPVDEISVGFIDQVSLVGNGFEVHDPQGNLLAPFIATDDNKVFRFLFDPPLAGGLVTVDYHVRALDSHVQEGSFSFTVAAPLAPTSTGTTPAAIDPAATTATSAPTTDPPTTDPTTTDSTTTDSTTTASAAAVGDPATTTPATAVALVVPSDGSDDHERTLMFVVLLGVAAASGGFLVIRSRRPA